MAVYAVESNYGESVFQNESDAIRALWLLAPYHNFRIESDKVRKALDTIGFYEEFPIGIRKCEY